MFLGTNNGEARYAACFLIAMGSAPTVCHMHLSASSLTYLTGSFGDFVGNHQRCR